MIPRVEDFLSGTDLQDPQVVGGGGYLTLPDKSLCRFLATLPLPGVVIFVHGVNSDGEWYDAAEQGLCAGLNARLARKDEQIRQAQRLEALGAPNARTVGNLKYAARPLPVDAAALASTASALSATRFGRPVVPLVSTTSAMRCSTSSGAVCTGFTPPPRNSTAGPSPASAWRRAARQASGSAESTTASGRVTRSR